MEFIERLDLTRVEFLKQMPLSTFATHMAPDTKSADLKTSYKVLQELCRQHIKAKGEVSRFFAYPQAVPNDVGGRLFCGHSLQGTAKAFRGFLCGGSTTDIDMANAHPTLLKYICAENNIPCFMLDSYIANREARLGEFDDRDYAKKLFLKSINDDRRNTKEKNEFFVQFDREMKALQKAVTKLDVFQKIVEQPSTKKYNMTGSALNKIMCHYENRVLHCAISHLQASGIEVLTPMFDGCLVYGDHYDCAEPMLKGITEVVEAAFPGLEMAWTVKPHCEDIEMPADFEPSSSKIEKMANYEQVKAEFEKTHAKIINRAIFLKQDGVDGEVIYFSLEKLKMAYSHIKYETYDDDKQEVTKIPFMVRWLQDENMRTKLSTGVYPNPDLCPESTYNLWSPFAMEGVKEYVEMPDALAFVRNHIKILSGNDDAVAEYFEMWIGQMLAHPEVKSNLPILISAEGGGKGFLMDLFRRMLGASKVLTTTTPSRDVWGDFNSPMVNSYLVNLNEFNKKESSESLGRIKGLVTDHDLTINAKGLQQYSIQSFHRFIAFTNDEGGGIKTERGDRRKWVVRASDELKGNSLYFEKFHELLCDKNVIKTCYEYFKNLPGLDKFNRLPLPVTDHQTELKEINSSPIERWVLHYFEENSVADGVTPQHPVHKMLAKTAFEKYNTWRTVYAPSYSISAIQFGVRLGQLRIGGVTKTRTKSGMAYLFDFADIKQWAADVLKHKLSECDGDGEFEEACN